MDQIAEALRGLLVAASWPVDLVDQYITTE
jgi:hypothetical protein